MDPWRSRCNALHSNNFREKRGGHGWTPIEHARNRQFRFCFNDLELNRSGGQVGRRFTETKTASVGSVSRVPATDIESIIVKSLNEHLIAQKEEPASSLTHVRDRKAALEPVARIDVHEDRLAVRLKSAGDEASDAADDYLLSIPWQKPPSRKSRQILIPRGIPKNEIRPTRIERRARLVSAMARGRRWLDEIVSGSVTDIKQIATRQKCSVRQVNMTISLAFLAPDLVRAAVEGRLPRGIGVERLRDATAEWNQQFELLGLNPQ